MASTDARPIPVKNTAYRVTFPILDADGDLVTGAAALDSEVSKDGATFADCTNEATEIATASGMYFLDLTATEMNADCVAIIVKTSTSGAKTVPIVLYPQEAGDIKVDVQSILGTALTETAGQIAAGFKKLFDVAAPVFTLVSVNQTGDAFARLGAPAGASVSADVAAVNAGISAIGTIVAALPSANQNADALLDRAAGVETGWTLRQAMRIALSALAGKASGLGTASAVFRDVGDTKNRITAGVDVDGNRTSVTLDAS